ncbi:MAG: transcription antitermination factor NusB [Flavobacteriaceae bacterium]|nr:transcription antitermination factor NusB [Flavobacteriaceae bacterium]MDG1961496.1 transcription antitermination factor NusB [Flavobacteriaceae bacterium]
MLTRRHIRVKVLQSLYAWSQDQQPDHAPQHKFLSHSLEHMQDLQALMLMALVAMRDHAQKFLERSQQKHLASDSEKNPSFNLLQNRVIQMVAAHQSLNEFAKNRKLNHWIQDDEYIAILFNALKAMDWYHDYLALSQPSFDQDKEFVIRIYREVLAPNDKLYDYLEDKSLTWVDDFPWVNTAVVKTFNKLSEKNPSILFVPGVFKDKDDRAFSKMLFQKVLDSTEELDQVMKGKTPNWDQERIADLDLLILRMGITEFLYFPSIPVRVTINEYLEIAKEYSTPKSSLFINGILDHIVKEFMEQDKLNKSGRGLT